MHSVFNFVDLKLDDTHPDNVHKKFPCTLDVFHRISETLHISGLACDLDSTDFPQTHLFDEATCVMSQRRNRTEALVSCRDCRDRLLQQVSF